MLNKSQQRLDERIITDIEQLKRDLRELKNRQLIGGDNTVVEGTNLATASATIDPGIDGTLKFTIVVTPASEIVGLIDLATNIYIDTDDEAYSLPNGASLGVNQKRFRWSGPWLDWAFSDDTNGERVFRAALENADAVPHTIYFKGKAYLIKNPSVSA